MASEFQGVAPPRKHDWKALRTVFVEGQESLNSFSAALMHLNDGTLPVAHMKDGDYVAVSETCACDNCRQVLEREAAKSVPSWCIVEIREAPRPKTVIAMNGRRKGRWAS